MAILQRTEAVERARLIDVTHYDLRLDLTQGEQFFGSVSRIDFVCREPGSSSFVEVKAASVSAIELNGETVDPAAVQDGRLALTGLRESNTLTVTATMKYNHDGQGLHRAVDPVDGAAYIYGMSFLDAAPQVFACFDQPDLKAPYDIQVIAPPEWVVGGNGPARQEQPGHWRLATTPPLSTYFFTVCAGPYRTITDEHDGIVLGLHVRASLGPELERHAPQIFEVTKAGLDYYRELYGIGYPWGEYHQFFVPEFNAGAMENPGCVTLREQMIFRGAATRNELLERTNTVLHEMAHMWFGDLVTMRWWDDLWLNESFAEYMSHRACVAVTEFHEAWIDQGISRKNWGYAADRAPSTHPIAGAPAEDGNQALTNFDGISYAKGSSALRQLAAYVGDEAFVAGVRDYLERHSYGNATLADFLGAVARAAGQDLAAWSAGWLETAGTDRILVRSGDGEVLRDVEIIRAAPPDRPAERPHVLDVAGFTDGRELWRTDLLTVNGNALSVPSLEQAPRPALLVPNASDLTWALTTFDEETIAALPDQLSRVGDAQVRQVCWSGLINGMAVGTVDPRVVLSTFCRNWPSETESALRELVSVIVPQRMARFLPYAERYAAATSSIASTAAAVLRDSSGADQIVPARVLARVGDDVVALQDWMNGDDLPEALAGDIDFRWMAVVQLAALGHLEEEEIRAFAEHDQTMTGRQSTLRALAARPTTEAKQWAWDTLRDDDSLSNYEAMALCSTVFHGYDPAILRPFVPTYFEVIPALADRFGEAPVASMARSAFPTTLTESDTVRAAHEAIGEGSMSAGVRRSIVDQLAQLEEALFSQMRFPARA